MAFIKSKRTTYRNQPVGVVPVNTGAEEAAVQSAKLFAAGQEIAWEEAKNDAIARDINTAKTLPIEDQHGNLSLEKVQTTEFTAVGKKSAKAVLAERFSGFLNNKVTKEFSDLHTQNPFNKERFDGEAQGTIDGFVDAFKKNGLDEYIPEFLQKVTNKKILHSNKILNDTIKKEKDEAASLQFDAIQEFINVSRLYPEDLNVIIGPQFDQAIKNLESNGYLKSPAKQALYSELKRAVLVGTSNKILDRLNGNDLAAKDLEEISQNENASPDYFARVIRASNNTVTMKELKDFQKLSLNVEANRTDINVMTQHISNRAGDFAKRRTNLGKEQNVLNMQSMLNGLGVGNAGYLDNDKTNRDNLNTAIGNELKIPLNNETFYSMNNDTYSKMLTKLSIPPVLPSTLDDLFQTNTMNLPAFRNLPLATKNNMMARELNAWNNLAYITGSDGVKKRRLQGYDTEYKKYEFINEIARVNGNDITKANSLYYTKTDSPDTYKSIVMNTLSTFDKKVGSVKEGVNAIFELAEIPLQHRSQLDSYVEKLLYYKSVATPDDEAVEFSQSNLVNVLKETYKGLYIEDPTIYDVFNGNNTGRTYTTPQKKYIGQTDKQYDKFLNFTQELINDEFGEGFKLADNVFLLGDANNSQYGNQRYTFVNKQGEILPSQIEGTAVEFTTNEFEKAYNISKHEINTETLNEAVITRAKKIIGEKAFDGKMIDDLNIFKLPNLLSPEFQDHFSGPIEPTTAEGKAAKEIREQQLRNLPRQFQPAFKSQQAYKDLHIPRGDFPTRLDKFLDKLDSAEQGLPNKIFIPERQFFGSDSKNYEETLRVDGYENPLWERITDFTVNNLTLSDNLKAILADIMTPDVAVDVQETIKNIVQTTANHEGFRNQVYRDRDTISVGFGFNVKFLTEDDYKMFDPTQVGRLKELQQWLLKKDNYSEDQLLKKVNEFKFGKPILIDRNAATKVFNNKMYKIYEQYKKEFPNFDRLHKRRKSALIDFSYQFGHERLKSDRGFPKYYRAVQNAMNAKSMDERNYFFKLAGFHQVYNTGEFGNTKTPLYYQTKSRVRTRTSDLGFNIRDNVDFLDEEFS
tara:strand:- start:2847 stop:6098 length:3252 start_codon:yes stop_codon:yes gene_type:complete